jgi:hypothetical protein
MNTKKYIFLALTALLAAACHDSGSWDEPSTQAGMEAYGNQHLKATNLKTIAEVKAIYSNVISGGSLEQITEPMQIQGVVVGNDEGGNIYQALYLQDASGAISISISQAGLYGPFAIGQAVMVAISLGVCLLLPPMGKYIVGSLLIILSLTYSYRYLSKESDIIQRIQKKLRR